MYFIWEGVQRFGDHLSEWVFWCSCLLLVLVPLEHRISGLCNAPSSDVLRSNHQVATLSYSLGTPWIGGSFGIMLFSITTLWHYLGPPEGLFYNEIWSCCNLLLDSSVISIARYKGVFDAALLWFIKLRNRIVQSMVPWGTPIQTSLL